MSWFFHKGWEDEKYFSIQNAELNVHVHLTLKPALTRKQVIQ